MILDFGENVAESLYELFERLNPRSAAFLSFVDTSGLEYVQASSGENILFDKRAKTPYPLHSPESLSAESLSWAQSISSSNVKVALIFGVGSGYHLLPLISWLEEDDERRLVVLEDDLETISLFLETEQAKKLLFHPQIMLLCYEHGDEGRSLIEKISWALCDTSYLWKPSPAYSKYRPKNSLKLEVQIKIAVEEVKWVFDEYISLGLSYFRNFWRNLRFFYESKNGHDLFGQFRGIPAVIVGAGPSLERDLEVLRSIRGKCLIFAGGSALSVLADVGIKPHFAAGVDPNLFQYVRIRQAQHVNPPFFYSGRVCYEALDSITGPLLYLRSAEGYGVPRFIEQACGVSGRLIEGGHSVTNLLVEIAYSLGCRDITLLGMDLSYTGSSLYPKQVEHALAEGESRNLNVNNPRLILAEGTDGESVQTESKWITEGEWISHFKRLHPRLRLFNSTPHGLKIQGLETVSLEDFAAPFQEHDLYGLVDSKVASSRALLEKTGALLKGVSRFYKSVQKSLPIVCELEKRLKLIPKKVDLEEDIDWQKEYQKLQGELFYRALAFGVDKMWTKLSRCREFLYFGSQWTEARAFKYRHKEVEKKLYLFRRLIETQTILIEGVSTEWTLRGIDIAPLSLFEKRSPDCLREATKAFFG